MVATRFQWQLPKLMRRWLVLVAMLACEASFAQAVLPSDVAVTLQAEPSSNLEPGQPIRLTITVTNNGPVALDNFGVNTDNVDPNQIDVTNPDTDCGDVLLGILDGATSFWYILTWYPTDTSRLTPRNWPIAVGESHSCHYTISLMPTAPQTVSLDFHLGDYWSDPNPSNDVGRVTLQRAAAVVAPIPVGSSGTLVTTALLLLSVGFVGRARWTRRQLK